MSFIITKADGSKQLFDREKVIKTCLRLGANIHIAEEIAEKVEARLYNGIETKKILQMIFRFLRKYKPTIRHLVDLRKGLSLMDSKPGFELFVQILLREHGYEVTPNQIIRGKCVEHEVDAVAEKDGVKYLLEVKHHSNYHTSTGLDASRIIRAVLEDVTEGFELGLNALEMDEAMIVTNTKFSDHAKRYCECRKIIQIGWSSPPYRGLQDLIEEKKLHPITCLKGLERQTMEKLASAGMVLIKQLVEEEPEELGRRAEISKETVESIIERAKTCSYALSHH